MARDKCVTCGRFFRYETGCSWAQNWSYDMTGSPDLHDPRWRCKPCTDHDGPLESNCGHPERYSGVLELEPRS